MMNKALLVMGVAGVCATATPAMEQAKSEPQWAEFSAFQQKFGKSYASEHRELQRYGVFKANLDLIVTENAKNQGFELGVNEFADLTHNEFFSQRKGYTPSLKQMWGGLKHLGTHKWAGEALPTSVDWTTKNAVTPVKNQGQCGSCWAFSTTGSTEGAFAIKTGKLVSFSEQQLVDCAGSFGNQGCNGGLMDNAFKYLEQADLCTEASYSYTAAQGTCHASNCTVGLTKGSVTGYKDVAKDSEKDMMSAVALGPVSVAIEADQSVFQSYKSGVLAAQCGAQLDHGVLVVGYGTLNGKDYWKVKNSWGPTWGLNGFILLSRGKGQAGECGLLSVPSYPVVKGSSQEVVV